MSVHEPPKITPKQLQEAHTRGVEIKLPSGITAYLRPVTTTALIKRIGRIPDELTSLVTALVNPSDEDQAEKILVNFDKLTPEVLQLQMDFLDKYCQIAFVSPRIVDDPNPENNEISADWLSEEDKGTVLALINAPARDLYAFRAFQTESYSGVEPQSGLSPAAESDVSDSGDGSGEPV